MYEWQFDLVWRHRAVLLDGLAQTLLLNGGVMILGLAIGTAVGFLAYRTRGFLGLLVRTYIDVFRALPTLVMLIWFFFCMPIIIGVRLDPFGAALAVLSINLSAFIADIVKGGLDAIPPRLVRDAQSLGLGSVEIFRSITLPIAARMMFPAIVGQCINTFKLSVLASAIAFPELLHRTTDLISQLYRPLEFYTAMALLFLAILWPATVLARRLEVWTRG